MGLEHLGVVSPKEMPPIQNAVDMLNAEIQQCLKSQQALEEKLAPYYVPYPVRDIRNEEQSTNVSATHPMCSHVCMLHDMRKLVLNICERQESLFKALQV